MTPSIPKTKEVIAFEKHIETCPQCSSFDENGPAPLCEDGFRLLQEAVKSNKGFGW